MLGVLALVGTSFSVSLDTLLVGMNLAYKKTHVGKMLYFSLITALVCASAGMITHWLNWEYQVMVGAALLIAMGIYNMLSLRPHQKNTSSAYISTLTIVSIVMSLDNAGTAAMMVLVGYNAITTTIVFGLVTFCLLLLGATLSKVLSYERCRKVFWLAGLYLIGLGVYKLVQFFFFL